MKNNSVLVAVFDYFDYYIIKDVLKIENKKKIEKLGKKLLQNEKSFSVIFTEIAEEKAKQNLHKCT